MKWVLLVLMMSKPDQIFQVEFSGNDLVNPETLCLQAEEDIREDWRKTGRSLSSLMTHCFRVE